MPDKEKSNPTKIEMPSEVLRVIGLKYLPLRNPIAYNAALDYLQKTYKERGLQWIKDNVEQVRSQVELGKMF